MLVRVFRLSALLSVAIVAIMAWGLAMPSENRAWAAETPKPIPTPETNGNGNGSGNGNGLSAMPAGGAYPGAYNYYVHPGEAGLVGAQLYVAPRPTPPLVGHTYVTYPPLMPHEFLYQHHRVYRTYNPGSGWTRTRARWH